MRPTSRTPQQRDRRFARARRLTQVVFVGAGAVSAVLTGYVAANAKPVTTTPVTAPTTTTTAPTSSTGSDDSSTPATTLPVSTAPTTAPVTSTTVCTTTPSGTVTCY